MSAWVNRYFFNINKEILKETEEIMALLAITIGANRNVNKDLGGYIAILESKEDVSDINKS